MTNYYDVGKIANTHGIKGELKVFPTTDFVEKRFVKKAELFIKHAGQMIKVHIKSVRKQKNFLLVLFEEYADINDVELYKSDLLYVNEADLHELEENTYYYHDIIGLKVEDEESGQVYGEVTEILSPGANDVWVVAEPNGKTFMLPFIKQVVKQIDLDNKIVKVELLEGLRDED